MVFSAVYLDHHWIIDVILGLAYASSLHMLFRFVFAKRAILPEPSHEPSSGARHAIADPVASFVGKASGSSGG
jgi:membrane-associated phospholipid phosphatase